MSNLDEITCSTVLEAIKTEKQRQRNNLKNKDNTDEYVEVSHHECAFWTDLFANCFLCYDESQTKNELHHDDMLFFVSKINPDESKIEVYRKDSKRLPCLTDFNYDWEETVYLNLILHQLEYTLTCAICIQTRTKDLEILKKHSKSVFASPSKRDLKSKGTEEIITYPNIYFTVDDFDDAFNEMVVKEGQMVCVELVARDGKKSRVLFLGSIKYEALKKAYDSRAPTGTKFVQKMSLGSIADKRVEFVRMKGPASKGYAEMAVSRFDNKPPNTSVPSTPSNSDSLQNIFKFSVGFRKKSLTGKSNESATTSDSLASTPEIEVRDFRQDFIESSSQSFWGRTFNQAMSMLKLGPTPEETSSSSSLSNADNGQGGLVESSSSSSLVSSSTNGSIPLNAYLTYVSLPLTNIMQDILGERTKSVLTF